MPIPRPPGSRLEVSSSGMSTRASGSSTSAGSGSPVESAPSAPSPAGSSAVSVGSGPGWRGFGGYGSTFVRFVLLRRIRRYRLRRQGRVRPHRLPRFALARWGTSERAIESISPLTDQARLLTTARIASAKMAAQDFVVITPITSIVSLRFPRGLAVAWPHHPTPLMSRPAPGQDDT